MVPVIRLSGTTIAALIGLVATAACGSTDPGGGDPPPTALQILTSELPAASTTAAYAANLVAQGGRAPYTWSLASGTLPLGLTMASASGELSGTPAASGNFSFVARVRDATGATTQKALVLTVSNASVPHATVTVTGTTAQTWRSWRFTARGNRELETCQKVPDAIVNAYLSDVVSDLGFNGVRIEQHFRQDLEAGANDDGNATHLDMSRFVPGLEANFISGTCQYHPRTDVIERTVIPMRTMVQARGEPFESYLSFVYFDFDRMPAWWRNDVEEAAEAVEAWFTWFRQHYGFVPNWFTFNEPDATHFGSTRWMGYATVAIERRLESLGVQTGIEQPSRPTPAGSLTGFDNIAGVSGATATIRRVAFHGYDYNGLWPSAASIGARNDLRSRARAIGAETAMTEVCCREGWNGGYDTGLAYVRDIYLNATEADISVWEPLGIYHICQITGCNVGNGSGQNLINIEKDLSGYYRNPAYWVTRQLSRYIRPGHVRLETTCQNCPPAQDRGPGLKALAWRAPDGSRIVNLVNDTDGLLTVTIAGLPGGNFELHKLDPTLCSTSGPRDRCAPVKSSQAASGSLTVSLAPRAVWTIRQGS
jgi:hypothetical protein